MKRIPLLMVLLLGMTFAAFGGGQGESSGAVNEAGLEPVELEMYLLGDTQPDYEEMLAVLNEKLKEDINATLKVKFTTWSDWDTKYNLLLSAGEEFDLIFAATWTKYQEYARKGAFLPLESLLPEYAPETWESIPQEGWEQTAVDGSIYMVPMNALEFETHGLLYRLDLAKKYGMDEIRSLEEMEAFFQAVAENEPGMLPLSAGATGPGNGIHHVINAEEGVRAYPWEEAANKLFRRYLDEDEWFFPLDRYGTDYWERMHSWYEAGYWPKNILSSQLSARDNLRNGTSASAILNTPNANDDAVKILGANPEWELDWFNFEHRFPVNDRRELIGNGMSINDNAEHPERALMFLELVHNDFEYYMLMTNGIEGRHWELDESGAMVLPEGVDAATTGFAWDAPCPWGWREQKFHLGGIMKNPDTMPVIREWWETWSEDAILNTNVDFAFDPTPVATELAALSNVQTTYETALKWGVVDINEVEGEFREALAQAGLEEVQTELNRQWREYKAAK